MRNTHKFKILFISSFLTSILFQTGLQADTFIGSDIEIGMWMPSSTADGISQTVSDESSTLFASATIEHPLPILPNIKVGLSSVDNNIFEYTKIDATAYYEILDNDAVSIDVGLGASAYMDGKYLAQDFDGVLPHVYLDAEVMLPFTGTTAYTDIRYIDYDGNSITDAIVGLRYDVDLIATELAVKAGYRVQSINTIDLDDLSFDIESDGYFIGLHADF